MSYRILWEEKGLVQKFTGSIDPDQLLQCNQDIYGDSQFDDIHYQLLDLLDVTKVDMGDEENAIHTVEIVAALDRAAAKSNPNVRVAIVAKMDVLLALANLYSSELTQSPWQSEAFETEQAAREWLLNH